jgi:hypothetical protein
MLIDTLTVEVPECDPGERARAVVDFAQALLQRAGFDIDDVIVTGDVVWEPASLIVRGEKVMEAMFKRGEHGEASTVVLKLQYR